MTGSGASVRAFFGAMVRALGEEATYDLRHNPTLWLGFITALPIPILALLADVPVWMKAVAGATPFIWAALLGAAGRVGLAAQEETARVVSRAASIEEHLAETEEALGEEVLRREELQEEQERMEREFRLAEAVQRSMVPGRVRDPRLDVAVRAIPSKWIGGDYVHTTIVEGRYFYAVVADASGHGISAALVVARIHGMVRRLTLTGSTPAAMLRAINRAALVICEHTYFFITCAVVRLDLATGKLRYATAGHPGQILVRRDGSTAELRTRNRLLGIDLDIFDRRAPTKSVRLEPMDTLVMFTDGVYEILKDGHGDVLGERGLRDRIESIGPIEPPLLLGELLQDLSTFQGRTTFEDDITLLVARYNGPPT